MSLFRTYIDTQSTLILNNYTNNSKNPVLELVRGSNLYSRYIFSIDISDLRDKFNNNLISSGTVTSHKVKFYNAISFREDLIGKTTIDGFYRDNNVNLQLFAFDEDFPNGIYFDYIYSTGQTFTQLSTTQQVPNWFYKDKINQWVIPGIYSGNTPSNILDVNYIEQGNENLEFDITAHIQAALFNTSATTVNLGISYPAEYEESAISGATDFKISFFSKYTQTFFEPFLETIIDDVITDDRNKFYLDNANNLYLYTTKENITVQKVEIYDYEDNLYTTITGDSITRINKNVYNINLTINSTQYPDMVNFTDKWYYAENSVDKTFEQEFTLLTQELFNGEEEAFQNSSFFFSVVGLTQNDKINGSSIVTKRIQIKTKRLYGNSIEHDMNLDFIQYRLYVLQGQTQIEIIPFTRVNKTFYNNYFDLDVESLIPNTYYLEVRAKKGDLTFGDNQVIKFNVVSER